MNRARCESLWLCKQAQLSVLLIFHMLEHFIESKIGTDRYCKYQLVPIRVEHRDFTDIPWLVDRAGHICTLLARLLCKGLDVAVEAAEHAKVQRYAHAF